MPVCTIPGHVLASAIKVLPLNGLHKPLHADYAAETLKSHNIHVLPTLANANWATDLMATTQATSAKTREVEC